MRHSLGFKTNTDSTPHPLKAKILLSFLIWKISWVYALVSQWRRAAVANGEGTGASQVFGRIVLNQFLVNTDDGSASEDDLPLANQQRFQVFQLEVFKTHSQLVMTVKSRHVLNARHQVVDQLENNQNFRFQSLYCSARTVSLQLLYCLRHYYIHKVVCIHVGVLQKHCVLAALIQT